MFTGIIEEIGKIKALKPISGSIRITVDAKTVTKDMKIDDSVSLNGACQTVIHKSNTEFTVEAVEETLKKTTARAAQELHKTISPKIAAVKNKKKAASA